MNKTTYIIETSNTYDAAGTKLRKVAYDNSGVLISRTEYIGGIQYESLQPLASPPLATDLKFMSTGEGRVVKEGSNWNYEYYHKDHLGNTRVVYGYQKQVDEYKATMETQFSTKEESLFYNIATRRATIFNHTAASIDITAPDRSAETNGNTSKAIGPAKMLQVSAGDRVQLEVFARYQTGTGGNNALISNLASAVTGSFLLNAGEAAHTAITNSVPTQAATISQTSGVPKSYLFYILFNSSYVYQQFGYVLVNSTAQAGHQQMYLDITVPTGGYLYTYVANESNVSASSVYYDDFTIVHTRSTPTLQVLQTSDYYPFGLQIAAGSYQKQTALDNDYLYNGKELQDEHNLGWLDYGARMYMPEIGRWGVIDQLTQKMPSFSPYSYAINNPIRFIDVDGLYPKSILTYDPKLGLNGGYRFTQSAAHLLSLVSGVDRLYIEHAIIQERAPGQYRPFYSANKGGGAMTLGWNSVGATINYTENYFADDRSSYKGHGYGQDIFEWLDISSHEVGHLPQIDREGGLFGYLGEFIKQYSQAGEHDGAEYEEEAEEGSTEFGNFYKYANKNYGSGALEGLFNSDGSQARKIRTINQWWGSYQQTQTEKKKEATKTFMGNASSAEEGTYVWNGSAWVRQ